MHQPVGGDAAAKIRPSDGSHVDRSAAAVVKILAGMDDEELARRFYSIDETHAIVGELRALRWPLRGSVRCPACGHTVRFKPGATLRHDYVNVESCDRCGRRPRVEIERQVGIARDDDD